MSSYQKAICGKVGYCQENIEMVKLIQDDISLVTNNMAHFKNVLTAWDDALKLSHVFWFQSVEIGEKVVLCSWF